MTKGDWTQWRTNSIAKLGLSGGHLFYNWLQGQKSLMSVVRAVMLRWCHFQPWLSTNLSVVLSFTFFKDLNALIPDFFLDFQTFFLNLCIPQQVTGNDATHSTEHLAFTLSALSTSGRQPRSYKQKYFQSKLFTSVQKGKIKCVLKMLFFW